MKASFIACNIISGVLGGAIALGGSLVAHAQSASAIPPVVRAQSFELTDEQGNRLSAWEHSQGVSMFSIDGKDCNLILANGPQRGGAIMLVKDRKSVGLFSDGLGNSVVATDGINAAALQTGHNRSYVMAQGDGSYLSVNDAKFQPRAVIGHTKLESNISKAPIERPLESISLMNEQGNLVFKAP